MSNQPAPTRPWFRLASISRPAPTPTPEPPPTPAPAPPRPAATVRPTFRPTAQAQPPPPAGGVSSVPASPVSVGRASQPSSPSDKKTKSVSTSPVKTVPTATEAGLTASPPKTSTTVAVPTTSLPKTTTTASVPSSPAKLVGTTTTTSVPTSPAKTATTTTSVTGWKPVSSVTTTTRAPSPKPDMHSPIQSPKIKPPAASPTSPLTLPPPQLRAQAAELEPKIPVEAEQKTVLVQKTIEKPRGSWAFAGHQKDGGDTRKPSSIPLNEQKAKDGEPMKEKGGHGKKFPSKTEDDGTSVITLAGENKGAFMELIRSPHKMGFQGSPNHLQKRGNSYRMGSDGSDYQSDGSSSGEEGDGKIKEKSKTSSRKMAPMNLFMNNNVQGVNNSILYNSSCTHRDPGVHLSLYTKPAGGGLHVKERAKGYIS